MLHILALAAALAGPTIDLPDLFAEQLPRVKEKTTVPVLLPQRMPDLFDEYFPTGSARERRWDLDIGAAPNCGGSTACFVADFNARKGGTPFGRRKVERAGATAASSR